MHNNNYSLIATRMNALWGMQSLMQEQVPENMYTVELGSSGSEPHTYLKQLSIQH